MSTENVVSERDAILRERAAFQKGALHGMAYASDDFGAASVSFYPLPKVTRPRIVQEEYTPHTDGRRLWTLENGMLVTRLPGRPWLHWTDFRMDIAPHPFRVALWADLFAHPTEEVEDGA